LPLSKNAINALLAAKPLALRKAKWLHGIAIDFIPNQQKLSTLCWAFG
jgi:hypothetical protein